MSTSQSHTLHRSLLRPFVVHTLRAAGFHSTKPSVLDTLVNLTERYLLLLASTTAKQALNSHNHPVPTLGDVRSALQECGVLIPWEGGAGEEWREEMRRPVETLTVGKGSRDGGLGRREAEKRKRDEEDVGDVRAFVKWVDSTQYAEIKRVAGLEDADKAAAVGVGGGVVAAEDLLGGLKKRFLRGGDEGRLVGTVLGRQAEGRGLVIEGGPVQRLGEWRGDGGKMQRGVEMEGAAIT